MNLSCNKAETLLIYNNAGTSYYSTDYLSLNTDLNNSLE